MRDTIENLLSGLALAGLVAGILMWGTIFQAMTS